MSGHQLQMWEQQEANTAPNKEDKENGRSQSVNQASLCYASLDDLSAEDNVVSALSDQANAGRLHNSRMIKNDDAPAGCG